MSRRFTRTVEDFTCENCQRLVHGNGYTNHCPGCLWSKHVDIYPGDRAASCGGLMDPVQVELEQDRYVLTHRCLVCGHVKRNQISDIDDFDAILGVAANPQLRPRP